MDCLRLFAFVCGSLGIWFHSGSERCLALGTSCKCGLHMCGYCTRYCRLCRKLGESIINYSPCLAFIEEKSNIRNIAIKYRIEQRQGPSKNNSWHNMSH